jgi:hypothetical protein
MVQEEGEYMIKGSHHTLKSKEKMRKYNDGLNDLPVSRNRLWQLRHPERNRELLRKQNKGFRGMMV